MKKTLILLVPIFLFIAWCSNNATNIDESNWTSKDWLTVNDVFHKQLMETKYISDFKWLTYRISDLNEWESIDSDLNIDAIFDEKSSIDWGISFSNKNNIFYNWDESSFISFDVQADSHEKNVYPFSAEWNLNLVRQWDEYYAKINELTLDIEEEDSEAKMYSLLIDLFLNKWIDLETDQWSIISISDETFDISYMLDFLVTMLETPDLDTDLAWNFTFSVAEVLWAINNYIDLWFSTEWLNLVSSEWVNFAEFSDWIIQKSFTGSFKSNDALFDLCFVASSKWIEMEIYNIVIWNSLDPYPAYNISLKDKDNSKYEISFKSSYLDQELSDINLIVTFNDNIILWWNYKLSSLEFIWQDISGTLSWTYNSWLWTTTEMPRIDWEILKLNQLLQSL